MSGQPQQTNFDEKLDETRVVVPIPQSRHLEEIPTKNNEGATNDIPQPTSTISRDESQAGTMKFGGTATPGISDLPQTCRGNTDRGRFEEEEEGVRRRAKHSMLWLAIVNGYSALKVFAVHLISMESMMSIGLSVSLTIFTYYRTVRFMTALLSLNDSW